METRVRYIVVGLFTLICGFFIVAFVTWMQNSASFGARRDVLIKFHGPTPGLQAGDPVAFNGLTVGEVTRVGFDANNPTVVNAILAINPKTPLSATTQADLESSGLIGSTYVALTGGSADQPLQLAPGQKYPQLDARASVSLTQQARTALSEVAKVVSQNAAPVHDIIANIDTFSGVLSRNSAKIDDILGGLARLAGGPGSQPPPIKTFDLMVPASYPGFTPGPSTQLVVADPTSVVVLDTQRFLSRAASGQISLETSQWADSIPKLVQRKVVVVFDRAKYKFANPPTDGLTPDYQLLLDVRAFEIDKVNPPQAVIGLNARLQNRNGDVVATAPIEAEAPASAIDGADAAKAMDEAFAKAATKLLVWYQSAVASQPAIPPAPPAPSASGAGAGSAAKAKPKPKP